MSDELEVLKKQKDLLVAALKSLVDSPRSDRSDPQWEIEKQRARDWAERHLPFIRLSVRQAS
jgi:hypothetical protein